MGRPLCLFVQQIERNECLVAHSRILTKSKYVYKYVRILYVNANNAWHSCLLFFRSSTSIIAVIPIQSIEVVHV